MDCSSEKVDESIKDIDKMFVDNDEITKQDLILVIATHIKYNIQRAGYYSKELATHHRTIVNQYKTLERLLGFNIEESY